MNTPSQAIFRPLTLTSHQTHHKSRPLFQISHTSATLTPRSLTLSLVLLLHVFCQQAWGLSCVQCEGGGGGGEVVVKEIGGGGPTCISDPPSPLPCPESMTFCITVTTQPLNESTISTVVRSCAPGDLGWDCETGHTEAGHEARVCHHTCDWDGCNQARVPHITPVLLIWVWWIVGYLL